jgi:hypothetical protein
VVNALLMPAENATIAVYESARSVETALQRLARAGFPPAGVSVAGRDADAGECLACSHKAGEGVRYWGSAGSFWNQLWDRLPGWALLNVPGTGKVLVAGALADWVVATLENAAIFSGLSAFGAALYSIGIPRDAIAGFESALAAGKYLVIAHGPAGEVARAKRVLRADGWGVSRLSG